jgi:hypothetical protein
MSDPKWEDTTEITPSWEDTSSIDESEPSKLESMAFGGLQGFTWDYGDELAGALGGAWDYMTDDEKKTLSEAYRENRDSVRERIKKNIEANPVTYYTSDVVSGIIPALFTGGATAAASIAKTGVKAGAKKLGKEVAKEGAEELAEQTLKQSMKEAAKIGARTGAAVGLGASEADLTKGELGEAAKDVALGVGTGALLAPAIPAGTIGAKRAGTAIKDTLVENIPALKTLGTGFKAGKEGITLNKEGVRAEIKKYSEELLSKTKLRMQELGLSKKRAEEIADEIGIRVNAGEDIQEVMDKIIKEGAFGIKDKKEKSIFVRALSDLIDGNDENIKIIKKLEEAAAKQAMIEKEVLGAEVKTTQQLGKDYDELLPLPDAKGRVEGLRTKFVAKDEFDNPIEYYKYVFQNNKFDPIKLKELDINQLKPSETEGLITYINSFTGDLTKPAKNEVEANARRLAGSLRDRLNIAMEKSGASEKNRQIANLYNMLNKLNVKGKLRSSEKGAIDQVDQVRKKISSLGESSEIDKDRVFEYMRKAGPDFEKMADKGEFVRELADLANVTGSIQSVNVKGLLGSAEGLLARGSNIAGKVHGKTLAPVAKAGGKVANFVSNLTDDALVMAKNALLESPNLVKKSLGVKLETALNQEGTKRAAALNSLSQVPAFRKAVQDIIVDMDKDMKTTMGGDGMDLPMISEPLEVEGQNLSQELARMDSEDGSNKSELITEQDNPMGIEVEDKDSSSKMPTEKTIYSKGETNLNEKLQGYVKSATSDYKMDLGGIKGAKLTGADQERGHGLKKSVKYIDPNTGEVSNFENVKMNIGYDYVPMDKKGNVIQEYNPMFGGKVVLSGKDPLSPGHGNSVIIKSNDTIKIGDSDYDVYAAYGHNDKLLVSEGDEVVIGDKIADMGGTSYQGNELVDKYSDHVDIRTFVVPKGEDWNTEKTYINPKELEYMMSKSSGFLNFNKDIIPELQERSKEVDLKSELNMNADKPDEPSMVQNFEAMRESQDEDMTSVMEDAALGDEEIYNPLASTDGLDGYTPVELDNGIDMAEALNKVKINIQREKADIASGGQGYERVTIDDLLGSIFDLPIDEELQGKMLDAAYNGDMAELERLISELE